MLHTNFDIAEYILHRSQQAVTPMKLQKLLYYCYAWQLVEGNRLFEAKFKAWKFGPVDIEIYHKYKSYGANPIPKPTNLTMPDLPLIDFVVDSYGVHSAAELSNTTHAEGPWKQYVNTNRYISDESLIQFYSQHPFRKNFPIGSQNVFYPPIMASHYMFTFDMEDGNVPQFESLAEYLSELQASNDDLTSFISERAVQN